MKHANKNILLITAITSLLIMGTSVIPMQSYAGGSDLQHKSVGDIKDSIKKDAKSEKANQHLRQDNACYRGDDCQQANEGQQIVGKDNEANGFNDQSANLPLALSPTGASVGNGTTPTPTCVECFTTAFAGLTAEQIGIVVVAEGGTGTSIQSLCDIGTFSESFLTSELRGFGFAEAKITDSNRLP